MGSEPEMRPIEPLMRDQFREVWEKAERTLWEREVLSIVFISWQHYRGVTLWMILSILSKDALIQSHSYHIYCPFSFLPNCFVLQSTIDSIQNQAELCDAGLWRIGLWSFNCLLGPHGSFYLERLNSTPPMVKLCWLGFMRGYIPLTYLEI